MSNSRGMQISLYELLNHILAPLNDWELGWEEHLSVFLVFLGL